MNTLSLLSFFQPYEEVEPLPFGNQGSVGGHTISQKVSHTSVVLRTKHTYYNLAVASTVLETANTPNALTKTVLYHRIKNMFVVSETLYSVLRNLAGTGIRR